MTTNAWQGTFFVSSEATYLSSADLSIEFMNSIADAKSIEIFGENRRLLTSLDMKDSANAIKSVVNCVRAHPLSTREAETPPQPETTISGTGFLVLSRFVLELGDAISGISRVPSQAARSIGCISWNSI